MLRHLVCCILSGLLEFFFIIQNPQVLEIFFSIYWWKCFFFLRCSARFFGAQKAHKNSGQAPKHISLQLSPPFASAKMKAKFKNFT
jgi:hypothetical protein